MNVKLINSAKYPTTTGPKIKPPNPKVIKFETVKLIPSLDSLIACLRTIATKLAVAQNFIRKVKTYIKSMPNWLLVPTITANNKQQVEFSNGSQIKASIKSALYGF